MGRHYLITFYFVKFDKVAVKGFLSILFEYELEFKLRIIILRYNKLHRTIKVTTRIPIKVKSFNTFQTFVKFRKKITIDTTSIAYIWNYVIFLIGKNEVTKAR